MSCGLILNHIIIKLFSDTKRKKKSVKKDSFSKIEDDKIYLYQGSLQDYPWTKTVDVAKKTLRTHHFIEKWKLGKHFGGFLSILLMKHIYKT